MAKQATSPTKNSLKYLRKLGCDPVAVVEHWNSHAGIRQDLFGIIDVIAINAEFQVVAVQSCAYSSISKRLRKMSDSPHLPKLLKAGFKIYVHGWKKNVQTNRYDLKEVELS